MAAATVGILRVLLSANTAEFEQAMQKASTSMGAISKEFNQVGQQLTRVGTTLTAAVTVPIVGMAAGAVKAAMDFETSFANVAKTVDGVADSAGQLTPKGEALAKVFREMSKEIPATTEELTKIAALGGQMGVPAEKLAEFTRHVAALGVAVDGISTEEAAAGLAQIGNIAGTGSRDIALMASTLVHLGNSSNATEADILEFTKRLMGAGTTVGMSTKEVMALGTAMANLGINAEAGGTAMSTIIGKLSKAVSEGGENLEAFARIAGKTSAEFAAIWKSNAVEAIQLVVLGLNNAKTSGADLNLVMGDLDLKGIRVSDTMKRMAGAGGDVNKMLEVANEGWASGTKHLEEAQKKYATTANQMKILWNQVKDLGVELGAALIPMLKSAVQAASAFVPVLELMAKAFVAMPQPIQLVVVGLLGLAAAIGPLLVVAGQMALGMGALTAAFAANGVAAGLAGPAMNALRAAVVLLNTPITVATVSTGLLTAAKTTWATVTGGVTIAVRALWAAVAAHPLVAVTAAIGAVTVATVGWWEAKKKLELQQQTEGAKQDAINLAIQRGATHIKDITDKTAQYTAAVKFLADGHKQAAFETTFWAKAQDEQQRGINTSIVSTNQATAATKTFAAELAAARKQLSDMSKGDLVDLTLAIKNHGGSVKELAERYGISELAVKVHTDSLKANTAATKEAETAASKHAKEVEKQEQALNKLGIVTSGTVNKALKELADNEKLATDAGANQNAVLAAMLPLYEQLRDKAIASGIAHDGLTAAFARAKAGSDALTASYVAMAPNIPIEPLTKMPGVLVDITSASAIARHGNKLLEESYKQLGITSPAELRRIAAEAVAADKIIQASATATEQIKKESAAKAAAAVKAANAEIPSHWETEILPRIKQAYENIVSGLSDSLARMMLGMSSFSEGVKSIWESVKQSLLSTFASILKGWIDGFLKKMVAESFSSSNSLVAGSGQIMEGGFAGIIGRVGGIMKGGFSGILGAMTGMLTSWIGIAMAAIGGIIALFNSSIFRGGEEGTQVNPARDQFLSQFGGSGTGPGSGFYELGSALEAAGANADALHRAMREADTMAEFNAAVAAINAALGGGGGGAFAPSFPSGGGGVMAPGGQPVPSGGLFVNPDGSIEMPEDVPGIHEMAAGGFGRVSRPTLFLAGESGSEDFAFSGANKSFAGGVQPSITVNFHGPVLAEEEYIQTTIVDNVLHAIRGNKNSAFTRAHAALGTT